MDFQFHDEGGFEAEATFLDTWLPAAAVVLEGTIGTSSLDSLNVVLSTNAQHSDRFPPDLNEARALSQGDDDPDDAVLVARSASYAHGVARCAETSMNPPQGIAAGEPTIWLDLDAIQRLASDLRVSLLSVLAGTAVHELSHIWRGHITDQGSTHGFQNEGDAQRDAWAVLGRMLAADRWSAIARQARVAQARLAPHQPRAYQLFGFDSADRYRPDLVAAAAAQFAMPSELHLPRLLTASEAIAEVAVKAPKADPTPHEGDELWLTFKDVIFGPWTVLAVRSDATVPHAMSDDDLRSGQMEYLTIWRSPDVGGALMPKDTLPSRPWFVARAFAELGIFTPEVVTTGDWQATIRAAEDRFATETKKFLADFPTELHDKYFPPGADPWVPGW